MYGKIFESIYDGTLAENWKALITFQQFIVLCDPDGIVNMTPASISRRTGIPIELILAGIENLENPDTGSRTDNEDGRRIKLLDKHRKWGWIIVNHKKYRDLRTSADRRTYMREYMRNKRQEDKLTKVNSKHSLTQLTNEDADADIDIKDNEINPTGRSTIIVPYKKIIELYHSMLPELPAIAKLTDKRKRQIRQRFLEDLKELNHWENFFDHVRQSDFLMGRSPSSNNRPPFRADIEWLTNSTNFTKIAESKYHVRKSKN